VDVKGSVALISGGASGLGLAAAKRLLDDGPRVLLADLPTSAGAEVASEPGENAGFAPADVTDEDALGKALDAAELGEPRVAVNCAGIAPPGRVIGEKGVLPLADFSKVVQINLIGTFNLPRLAAERMQRLEPRDGERGVLVCTASVAAFDGQVGQAAYSASKAGVAGMTPPIARDLADRQIPVVTIAPGIFDTPMMAGLPEDTRRSLGEQVPHPRRLGHPSEYGALVEHIVANPMLNGEVIRLDGAIRMAPR
jgi:NAD(P)-dependent dehydrogenase (short-subunit alcohol dehydrogenase family)